ncbi:phosphonate metabolism transcriptional regulator PhnF [Chelativorans sp. AA-79]|uniref:phosphonate metabolism transcriptional regulator PhnF n=1 Tax=Chelativorans sp. AA-79 TaxID=3028735 RepID=UPI0023F7170A|nr:phosphonate metabolism transcriptional regulator PhnF [Chelativorans sp. AA-79]WEX07201.1 phosphonate metabolism transcriptional regulator PhnF [Chelativorans sp. AA-79]
MKSEGISRWRQVGEALMREIDQGLLGPGDKLPAEFDLAERFGVARQTVRRALSHLRNEGVIDVQLGRGTFVSERVFEYRIAAQRTFEENLLDSAMIPSRDLLSIQLVPATKGIAKNLKLEAGSPVLFVVTVNKADEVPVVLGYIFFPHARIPKLEGILARIAAEKRSFSLAAALADAGVLRARRTFIRLKSRLPLAEETEVLSLPPLETVVETTSMSADDEGNPVFYSIMSYRGSRVEFFVGSEALGEK